MEKNGHFFRKRNFFIHEMGRGVRWLSLPKLLTRPRWGGVVGIPPMEF